MEKNVRVLGQVPKLPEVWEHTGYPERASPRYKLLRSEQITHTCRVIFRKVQAKLRLRVPPLRGGRANRLIYFLMSQTCDLCLDRSGKLQVLDLHGDIRTLGTQQQGLCP